jgi:fucose permease
MLAWFAYLQAAPGQVVPHLRDELDLTYFVGGLHVAGFAAGSLVAGLLSARIERVLGRARLLWIGALVLAVGAVGLASGPVVEATVGASVVMGLGGGVVLSTIQAVLADHHGASGSVALAEANVAAAVAYVVLIAAFALATALGLDWRWALLASLVVPALTWLTGRREPIEDAVEPTEGGAAGRLPAAFWVAALMLSCVVAVEWCVTAWGATFVDDEVGVSTSTAVTLMGGYFAGVVVGRTVGSRLTRRHEPATLLAVALGIAAVGFVVLWPAGAPLVAVVGLALLGLGIGNLFPMAVSVAVALAPGQAGAASGRAVAMTSLAVLLAPLTVGALADATSLKTALFAVPVFLALAAVGLAAVRRDAARAARAAEAA